MLSGKISFCIEINSEFSSRASPFRQKQILTGLLVRKIYKKKKKRRRFVHSITLCLATFNK